MLLDGGVFVRLDLLGGCEGDFRSWALASMAALHPSPILFDGVSFTSAILMSLSGWGMFDAVFEISMNFSIL